MEQIFLLPGIGLNIATLTLVAQNHGAGKIDRVQEVLKKSTIYGGIISGAGTLLVIGLARVFMGFFTKQAEVIEIGVTYLRIDALVFCGYTVLFLYTSALQGLKKPMFAMVIGLYRQILAPPIVFYLFLTVLEFGILGIWWGFFLITWSAAIIAFWFTRKRLQQEHGQ